LSEEPSAKRIVEIRFRKEKLEEHWQSRWTKKASARQN